MRETKQGAERVKTIVRDLQTFTRRDDGIRGPVDLRARRSRPRCTWRATRSATARSIVKRYEPIPPRARQRTRFEQLFLNLLINAAHAIADRDPARNTIEITRRARREATA